MNVLYLVPYAPTLIRTRPHNLLRHLARRGNQVTLASLWSDEAERAFLSRPGADGIRVIAAPLTRARSIWNCARALPTRTPLQAVFCWQPTLAHKVERLLSENGSSFDIIHVEHLRGVRYGLWLKSRFSLPIVWDSVDCISSLFEGAVLGSRSFFGRWVTRLELGRTRRYESQLLGQFDQMLVTSPLDKAAFESLNGRTAAFDSVAVLPNGVDLEYFVRADQPRDPEMLVFSGKMSYHANITAALHLVNDIMPLIWAKRPRVRVGIVGKDPPPQVRELATRNPQNVQVTGTVPDIRPYLHRATAAVSPIRYGAGIQNKVLEAMATGTPVVATSLALSALQARDGSDVLVADEPGTFAQAVLRLLDHRELQLNLGAAGRRYVEAHHDWNGIAARLEGFYAEARKEKAGGT